MDFAVLNPDEDATFEVHNPATYGGVGETTKLVDTSQSWRRFLPKWLPFFHRPDRRPTIYTALSEVRMKQLRTAQKKGATIELLGEGKGFLLHGRHIDMTEAFPYALTPKKERYPVRINANGTFQVEEKIIHISPN